MDNNNFHTEFGIRGFFVLRHQSTFVRRSVFEAKMDLGPNFMFLDNCISIHQRLCRLDVCCYDCRIQMYFTIQTRFGWKIIFWSFGQNYHLLSMGLRKCFNFAYLHSSKPPGLCALLCNFLTLYFFHVFFRDITS